MIVSAPADALASITASRSEHVFGLPGAQPLAVTVSAVVFTLNVTADALAGATLASTATSCPARRRRWSLDDIHALRGIWSANIDPRSAPTTTVNSRPVVTHSTLPL